MKRIKAKGIESVVYEPTSKEHEFFHSRVFNDQDTFKQDTDIVITNRMYSNLEDIKTKVHTRYLFGRDY